MLHQGQNNVVQSTAVLDDWEDVPPDSYRQPMGKVTLSLPTDNETDSERLQEIPITPVVLRTENAIVKQGEPSKLELATETKIRTYR